MKSRKYIKRWHRMANVLFAALIIMNFIAIFALVGKCVNNQIEGEENTTECEEIVVEIEVSKHMVPAPPANILPGIPIINNKEMESKFSRCLSDNDKYLLAKIAMAEAEGESLETKILVIMTVLNRVESNIFPNTIEEVIHQNYKGVYQFSPVIPGGRWYTVEPSESCWKAVEIVNSTEEDVSDGALFFESCKGESWHSRNLEFICQSDNMRFYR